MVLRYLNVFYCCFNLVYLVSCTEAVVFVVYAKDVYGKWFY